MVTIRVSSLADVPVVDAKDKRIGTIDHVLFYPEEARVVGFQVRLNPLGYVVERKPKFYAYDALEIEDDRVVIGSEQARSGISAEKRLGIEWEHTVIWRHQDVLTESGTLMGQVSEVVFSLDGAVRSIEVSGGATANVAIGRHDISVDEIIGFDGESIRVTRKADAAATSGGAAAAAGRSAAVAKHQAKKAASSALGASVTAAKVVRKSDTAKRAKKGWGDFKDAFREGLEGDEE